MKYLALLRGINVSGHHVIKMDALKNSFEKMGLSEVETYLQTGNVFFSTVEESTFKISFDIQQQIVKDFGFDVPVIIVTKSDLELCLNNNPFAKDLTSDISKLYLAFLSKSLNASAINDLKMSQVKPDEATIHGNKIFIKYDIGPAKTRLDQKYIEKKLKVNAIIRSCNSIHKMLEMY